MSTIIGIGIGIPFSRVLGSIGQTIAQNHHARVIAAGGIMPVTAAELASLLNPICAAYNITTTAQFNAQFPTFKDPHFTGYGAGAGAGVTLGQAVQVVYSINPAADAVQTTAASQPLLLAWNGQNYWWGSGVAGNFVSAGTLPPISTTQIDIKGYIFDGNYVSGTQIAAQDNGAGLNRVFAFYMSNANTGVVGFQFNSGFTGVQVSSVGVGLNYSGWVRVTYLTNGVNANITFYSSLDAITWTTLSTHTVVSSGLGTSNSPLQIGANAGFNNWRGKIGRVFISNVIDGAPVVDFNPQLYNAATSQTQWTSTTGEVWTINKSTGNTFAGKLVDRTYAMGNGTTTSMSVALAATQTYTEYVSFARNGSGNLVARATGNTRQHTGTNITLNNGTLLNLANTSSISQIATYLSKGATSSISANNGTPTVGNSGANNGTDLTILQGAHVFNSLVQSNTEDTTAQRLQIFNSLKLMAKF